MKKKFKKHTKPNNKNPHRSEQPLKASGNHKTVQNSNPLKDEATFTDAGFWPGVILGCLYMFILFLVGVAYMVYG